VSLKREQQPMDGRGPGHLPIVGPAGARRSHIGRSSVDGLTVARYNYLPYRQPDSCIAQLLGDP
jgi:hypothetical protein